MKKIMPNRYRLFLITMLFIIISAIMFTTTGCSLLEGIASIDSAKNDFKGSIIGTTFECQFYDNNGSKFMTVNGEKINMEPNIVYELEYVDGYKEYTKTMSSVMTITIDGSQIESCGSTILFIENGLKPDVDFNAEDVKNIESSSDGFSDNTIIASVVNQFKNSFGKASVVVIQSQLGDPICAFSGNDVYWEVSKDLPKTTKLMIDGKALYIHRANFQIVDKDLLN